MERPDDQAPLPGFSQPDRSEPQIRGPAGWPVDAILIERFIDGIFNILLTYPPIK